jgi:hypothetical protein
MLKQCKCYDYQTCETADWEETAAFSIVRSIKEEAISHLPGYEATPLGI